MEFEQIFHCQAGFQIDKCGFEKKFVLFLQIAQYFARAEDKNQLRLLGIKSIGTAVKAFIDKEDKDAINVIVENQVGFNIYLVHSYIC